MRLRLALLLLALAGCASPPGFEELGPYECSRYYLIGSTSLATRSCIAALASSLDTGVERVSADLGVALPEPRSLRAIVCADDAEYEARHAPGRMVAFDTPTEKAIVFPPVPFYLLDVCSIVDRIGGPKAAELRALAPTAELFAHRLVVHEVTHQLMDAAGRLRAPRWVSEGVAEYEGARALRVEDVPVATREAFAKAMRCPRAASVFVLAVRALYGLGIFDGDLAHVTWDRNYCAHHALATYFLEKDRPVIDVLERGEEVKRDLASLERTIPRWARLRCTEELAFFEEPEVGPILEALWGVEQPVGGWKTLVAREAELLAAGAPTEWPLALRERSGWKERPLLLAARARAALRPAAQCLFLSTMDGDDLDLAALERELLDR